MRKRNEIAKLGEDDVAVEGPLLSSALARGLAILRAYQPGDNHLGNAELADRVGLPKATVSRLTQTLAEIGMLTYLESIGKYELAPAVLSLGYSVLSRGEMHNLARPYMTELAKESGLGVGLGIRDGIDMTIIEYARGKYSSTHTAISVGRRLPAGATSMGWCAVHALPASEQSQFFSELRMAFPDRSEAMQARMLKAFDQIHQHGFCTSVGEFSPAYNSVGAPLLHPNGVDVFAFHVAGPAYFLPVEDMEQRWGPKLVEIAARLRGEI